MGTWSPGRIRLVFPVGHPQHGLEVVMRRQRIGEILGDLAEAATGPTDEDFNAMPARERAANALKLSERNIVEFAGLVAEWNFAEDGIPVPIDVEGVKRLDQQAFEAIQAAYAEATRKASPPLPQPSPNGEQSEAVLSLPQEPL
jgi:hypothetical protein